MSQMVRHYSISLRANRRLIAWPTALLLLSAQPAAAQPLDLRDEGVADPRLEGQWKLDAVDGVHPPAFKRKTRHMYVVSFRYGKFGGKVACNGFFGPYRTEGSTLRVGMFATTVGCRHPPFNAWDYVTRDAILSSHFEVTPRGRLIFKEPNGRTFTFRRLNH